MSQACRASLFQDAAPHVQEITAYDQPDLLIRVPATGEKLDEVIPVLIKPAIILPVMTTDDCARNSRRVRSLFISVEIATSYEVIARARQRLRPRRSGGRFVYDVLHVFEGPLVGPIDLLYPRDPVILYARHAIFGHPKTVVADLV